MKVVIFDDELWQKQPSYSVPGLDLSFHPHADDAVAVVLRERPEVVCMDFSMDAQHSGEDAIAALRGRADLGDLRIVAISSDLHANQHMVAAGADDAVPKTHLRAYLSRLPEGHRINRRLR
jgi:CheY-like chemotaxis protein